MRNSFIWDMSGWFLFGTMVVNSLVLIAPYATKNDTVKMASEGLTVCPSPAKVNMLDTKTGKIKLYVFDKCEVLMNELKNSPQKHLTAFRKTVY